MFVIAHMGHVLIDLPLFGGPVILMAAALWFSTWRGRRRDPKEAHRRPHSQHG
jgi:CBS-domain-containing membrane protein